MALGMVTALETISSPLLNWMVDGLGGLGSKRSGFHFHELKRNFSISRKVANLSEGTGRHWTRMASRTSCRSCFWIHFSSRYTFVNQRPFRTVNLGSDTATLGVSMALVLYQETRTSAGIVVDVSVAIAIPNRRRTSSGRRQDDGRIVDLRKNRCG